MLESVGNEFVLRNFDYFNDSSYAFLLFQGNFCLHKLNKSLVLPPRYTVINCQMLRITVDQIILTTILALLPITIAAMSPNQHLSCQQIQHNQRNVLSTTI